MAAGSGNIVELFFRLTANSGDAQKIVQQMKADFGPAFTEVNRIGQQAFSGITQEVNQLASRIPIAGGALGQLANSALRVGVASSAAAPAIASLKNIFDESDMAAKKLATSFTALASLVPSLQKAFDAAKTDRNLADTLIYLGANPKFRTEKAAVGDVENLAAGLSGISDPSAKAAAAMEIFGASTSSALPKLEKYTEAVIASDVADAKLAATIETEAVPAITTMGAGLGAAALGIAAILAAGAAFIGIMFKMADSTAKHGAELYKLHLQTGLTVEALSGMSVAAKEAGVSLETVARPMAMFNRLADQANQGNAAAILKLKEFGLTAHDVSVDSTKALGSVLDKILAFPPGQERAAEANRAFGFSGSRILPVLDQMKGGLAGAMDRAKALGQFFTNDGARASHEFEANLADLKMRAEGLSFTIGNTLIPYFNSFFKLLEYETKPERGMTAVSLAMGALRFELDNVKNGLIAAAAAWEAFKGVITPTNNQTFWGTFYTATKDIQKNMLTTGEDANTAAEAARATAATIDEKRRKDIEFNESQIKLLDERDKKESEDRLAARASSLEQEVKVQKAILDQNLEVRRAGIREEMKMAEENRTEDANSQIRYQLKKRELEQKDFKLTVEYSQGIADLKKRIVDEDRQRTEEIAKTDLELLQKRADRRIKLIEEEVKRGHIERLHGEQLIESIENQRQAAEEKDAQEAITRAGADQVLRTQALDNQKKIAEQRNTLNQQQATRRREAAALDAAEDKREQETRLKVNEITGTMLLADAKSAAERRKITWEDEAKQRRANAKAVFDERVAELVRERALDTTDVERQKEIDRQLRVLRAQDVSDDRAARRETRAGRLRDIEEREADAQRIRDINTELEANYEEINKLEEGLRTGDNPFQAIQNQRMRDLREAGKAGDLAVASIQKQVSALDLKKLVVGELTKAEQEELDALNAQLETQKRINQLKGDDINKKADDSLGRYDSNSRKSLFGDIYADAVEKYNKAMEKAGKPTDTLMSKIAGLGAVASDSFKKLADQGLNFSESLVSAFQDVAQGIGDIAEQWALTGELSGQAMKKLLAQTLAHYAAMWMIKAIDKTAEGLGYLASASAAAAVGDVWSAQAFTEAATAAFLSAAKYGIAGAAGLVVARGIAGDSFKQGTGTSRDANGQSQGGAGATGPQYPNTVYGQGGSGMSQAALAEAVARLNGHLDRLTTEPHGVVVQRGLESNPAAAGNAVLAHGAADQSYNDRRGRQLGFGNS